MTELPDQGSLWRQILPSFIATIGAFSCGTVIGWPAIALPYIQESDKNEDNNNNNNNTLFSLQESKDEDLSLSIEEANWLASLFCLGAVFNGPVVAVLMKMVGKKWTLVALSVPLTAGWLCLTFAKSLPLLYIGRIITGFAGGAFGLVAPAYTSEISETRIKGAMGSLQQLMVTLGTLMLYILGGAKVDWRIVTGLCVSFPVLLGVLMIFMPMSPYYLIGKMRNHDGLKNLKRLRGNDCNINTELSLIQDVITETENIGSINVTKLFTKREYLVPLLISLVVMFLQQFSGINAVLSFASLILKAGHADEDVGMILVGVAQVVGTAAAILLVDRLGRTVLLILSDGVMCLALLLLGVYFYLDDHGKSGSLGWLPVVALMVFLFSFAIGFGPLPWVLNSELFPKEAKGPASAICASFNWICGFFVVFYERNLEESVGKSTTYFIFSGICAAGALFVLLIVPETRNKTEEEMRDYFKYGGGLKFSRRKRTTPQGVVNTAMDQD